MSLPVISLEAHAHACHGYRVLLWTSSSAVARAVAGDLLAAGFKSFSTDTQSVLGIYADDLEALAGALAACIPADELRRTKTLAFEGESPSLGDFSALETAEDFIQHHSSRWLVELIEGERYKSLLQPIVEAESQVVHGYEFLLRGLNIEGEIVPPVDMFAAARGKEMSALLDSVARDCAVRTAARFGLRERLFINVLPASVSIGHSAFTDTLDLVESLGIPPEQVVFEIVESEAVDDIAQLAEVIDFCRSAGYRIALDDFGSGFSNVNMLIGVSPDYIKLDKSLVGRVASEPPIWTITANLIDAAKQSDVLVIAEGVEDEKTARLLNALGADFLQGYYFGRPIDRPIRSK